MEELTEAELRESEEKILAVRREQWEQYAAATKVKRDAEYLAALDAYRTTIIAAFKAGGRLKQIDSNFDVPVVIHFDKRLKLQVN